MMDWTDRHCRYFHRRLSRHALLYTEMVTAAALVRGGAVHLLEHDPAEHPLAVQLGGAEPEELGDAARLCIEAGFREINLNVGCPSDRVQSGCFGAVLMKDPALVADCLTAMIEAAPGAEITLKCRIGVDDQDPEQILPRFLQTAAGTGVRRITVHARKAWLKGLSPKENREIPPLDYALVLRMKDAFPDLHLGINGGIGSLAEAEAFLAQGMDGVMVGRAAYHAPADTLLRADSALFGSADPCAGPEDAAEAMLPYLRTHVAAGGRPHSVTRHMLGLFAGRPGARAWRRYLSTEGTRPGAGAEVLEEALALVREAAVSAA